MIKIYTSRKKNKNTKEVFDKLTACHIPYEIVTKNEINAQELKKILALTHDGFPEIMVSRKKAPEIYSKFHFDLEEIGTNAMLQVILSNPKVLRSPIVYDTQHLSVGCGTKDLFPLALNKKNS